MREALSLDRFKFVYWVIAFATAQHTAWGAATTMQGPQSGNAIWWWTQGLAFAVAIDFTMVMVATKLRSGKTQNIKSYIVTFATVAIISFYFQLLYAWAHTEALPNVGGIAQEWVERLQWIINARVVIAPMALPLIATLYTIGGLGKGGEAQLKQRTGNQSAQPPLQSARNDAIEIAKEPEVKQLPATIPLRGEDGRLHGYRCPGCGKELSISGWSRHKTSCMQYIELGIK